MRELSLHILDLIQNSLEAGATCIDVEITEDSGLNQLVIRISDNGRGMDQTTVKRVKDPFFTTRTTRHVGLGIPLLAAAAERCGGSLNITSEPGVGTSVVVEFQRDNIDRVPLGDMKSTLLGVLLANQECELRYTHRLDGQVFEFDTREIRQILGPIPFTHPVVRTWIEEYLAQENTELGAPTLAT
jgi:hypothetical protein